MSTNSPIVTGVRRAALADPGLIGLLGFVLATLTAQTARLGIQDEGPVFWVGAVFGGVVQVTAGMLSYFQGDNFHFMVYNAFGYYWIVVPGFLRLVSSWDSSKSRPPRGASSRWPSRSLPSPSLPAGAVHNTVLPVTLLFVFAGRSRPSDPLSKATTSGRSAPGS